MNIFVTNVCPIISAKNLDNKRVIKMILESAQLLSTCIHINDQEFASKHNLYKMTHKNHPCAIWVRESTGNFAWLLEHMKALCNEYTHRYLKVHKSSTYIKTFEKYLHEKLLDPITEFKNCTNFKNILDIEKAYQTAMIDKWINDKSEPKFTNRSIPCFWDPNLRK